MLEVELTRIIIDEKRPEQIVVVKDKNSGRIMPIVVGLSEALAVRTHLSGFSPPRPLTHDLIKSLFETLGISLEKVVIDKLVQGTFHAKLFLATKQGRKIVDARPSDSIALAVRTNSPLFVREEVFESFEDNQE